MRNRKAGSAVLIVIALLLFVPAGCGKSSNGLPVVKSGTIDLRTWDFEKSGPIDLRGVWKFRWMEDRPEFAAPQFDESGWASLGVRDTGTRLPERAMAMAGTGHGSLSEMRGRGVAGSRWGLRSILSNRRMNFMWTGSLWPGRENSQPTRLMRVRR
jgi:hypothetical protein